MPDPIPMRLTEAQGKAIESLAQAEALIAVEPIREALAQRIDAAESDLRGAINLLATEIHDLRQDASRNQAVFRELRKLWAQLDRRLSRPVVVPVPVIDITKRDTGGVA